MVAYRIVLLAVLPAVLARPQTYVPHEPHYCPIVDNAEDITGDPWQVGVSVPGGGTMQVEESHEIGTTWETGGEIGLSAGSVITGAAGFGVSVAESVMDSVTEVGGIECPDGAWHCSLMIYPGMTRLSGHMHEMSPTDSCDGGALGGWTHEVAEGDTWSVLVPRTSASGNGVWAPELCTCGNLENWADPGHPALLCKDNCVDSSP